MTASRARFLALAAGLGLLFVSAPALGQEGGLGVSTAEDDDEGGLGVSTADDDEEAGGLGVSTDETPEDAEEDAAPPAPAAEEDAEPEGEPAEDGEDADEASGEAGAEDETGEDAPAEDETAEDAPPSGPVFTWNDGKIAGWATFGASLGVGVLGAILLAAGTDDLTAVENAPGGVDWDDYAGAYERAPILTATGAVILGVGAAGLIAGAILLAIHGEGGTWMQVSVGPGGLGLRGAF